MKKAKTSGSTIELTCKALPPEWTTDNGHTASHVGVLPEGVLQIQPGPVAGTFLLITRFAPKGKRAKECPALGAALAQLR